MAKEDRIELLAQGVTIPWAVDYSIKNSKEAVAIYVNGELACITGLVIDDGLIADSYPWLLGTDHMQHFPKQVLKYSKLLINRWLEQQPLLVNYIDARYKRAITWLKHIGAELEYLPEHGLYKRPFYKFTFGGK